eukprot:CAMPEP_0179429706 /NCGR_PEP_ID=MMETSP0799-20121207/15003_1 /TAXON_ID=46947 /ORGANISM="Geminigera cryophila, Strain CCMP2564" /LENGTH=327 /DNA_ID=CAMNT_0021205719 /DNA_START=198 /DNA_END=1181 /DNA_ORIENTATION=+
MTHSYTRIPQFNLSHVDILLPSGSMPRGDGLVARIKSGKAHRKSVSIDDFLQNYVNARQRRHNKPLAIFTYVRNEPIFLPIMLKHYAAHVDPMDIYVLDNDSYDNCTLNIQNHVINIHNAKYFDHDWLIHQVTRFAGALLKQGYQRILFGDVDELVVPNPSKYKGGLLEYVSKLNNTTNIVRVTAFHVIHDTSVDPREIDLDRPILRQRHLWCRQKLYDKPLLTNKPLKWTPGFHGFRDDEDVAPDPDLVMFHLHYIDFNLNMKRVVWKLQQNIDLQDASKGRGVGSDYMVKGKIVIDTLKIKRQFQNFCASNRVQIPRVYLNPPLI